MCKKKISFCKNCSTLLGERHLVYCSNKCQKDFEYKEYIDNWKKGVVDGNIAKHSTSAFIRKYIFKKYNNKCSKCGWDELNVFSKRVPLELEHIDGNHRNNEEDNLTVLCPNCHSLTPTYRNLNKGKGRKYR